MNAIAKILFVFAAWLLTNNLTKAQIITWSRVYGGSSPEYGRYGIQTFDGGYIITASRHSQGYGNLLLKLNSYGIEEWSRIIDTVGLGICIQQTKDSGYILAGGSSGFAMLQKTDKSGNVLWKRLYTINNEGSTFSKVKITSSGDLIMCGVISFPSKAFVVKTDSNGEVINNLSFPYNTFPADAYDICESNDRFFYLTGIAEVNNKVKTLIAKISSNIQLMWTKSYGTEGEGDSQAGVSIISDSDTDLFLTGQYSYFYSSEAHFTKIDSSGNVIFQNVLHQTNSSNEMCKTKNEDFAIIGEFATTSDDIIFLLLNKKGEVVSRKLFNSNGFEGDFSHSIIESMDKGFLITGFTSYLNTSQLDYNIFVIKTDSLGNAPVSIKTISTVTPDSYKLYQNYPNPFNSQTKIKFDLKNSQSIIITLFDVNGKKIKSLFEGNIYSGTYDINFNSLEFPSGVYFYSLILNNNIIDTKRMIILK